MFTNRSSYLLLVVALMIVTACAPQAVSEPTSTIPPTAKPTTIQPIVTATTIAELSGIFEANGHSLYIKCLGTGSPTIVLETGEGGTVMEFSEIQKKLAERTTTCAYDRANNGRSDTVATPRTAKDTVEDLHALLLAVEVTGPYLLVGHSAGGMLVQLYARTYPDQVVGVVSMNPVPPAHPWLDEVSKIFTTEEYTGEEAYYHGQNGESLDYLTSSEQIAATTASPDVLFEMLISTDIQCEGEQICLKSYSTYEQIMQEVTAAWSNGNFSQVKAGHNIFSDDSDAVVAAVERVLSSR